MVVESHTGKRIFMVNLKARMGLELFFKIFLETGDPGWQSLSPPLCKTIARAATRGRKAGSSLTNMVVESHPGRRIFVVNLKARMGLELI